MSGPVKDWPSIIILGDDDVVGFNPPKPHSPEVERSFSPVRPVR